MNEHIWCPPRKQLTDKPIIPVVDTRYLKHTWVFNIIIIFVFYFKSSCYPSDFFLTLSFVVFLFGFRSFHTQPFWFRTPPFLHYLAIWSWPGLRIWPAIKIWFNFPGWQTSSLSTVGAERGNSGKEKSKEEDDLSVTCCSNATLKLSDNWPDVYCFNEVRFIWKTFLKRTSSLRKTLNSFILKSSPLR